MTHKVSVRNYVLLKSWFFLGSSQGCENPQRSNSEHSRRSAWGKEKQKKKRILIPFSSSQSEAKSGMRSQVRQTQATGMGRTRQQRRALFVPPVLARFLQRNPWRGDAEGKKHGDGWGKPTIQKAIMKLSRGEESGRRTGLEQMSAHRGNGPTSVQRARKVTQSVSSWQSCPLSPLFPQLPPLPVPGRQQDHPSGLSPEGTVLAVPA